MTSKFDFNEIVKVVSNDPKDKSINGTTVVVRGKAQNEETGKWTYGVVVIGKRGTVWRVKEENLFSTGKKANPDDFKPVGTVRVRVDPETGEGYIVDPEEESDN